MRSWNLSRVKPSNELESNNSCWEPLLSYTRHGRACPGQQKRHPASTDGRDKPGHDGRNEQ
jgi:hypothetical protein